MDLDQREKLRVAAEPAVLVGCYLPGEEEAHGGDERDPLRELRALAETAGSRVVGELVQRRVRPRPSTYLGKGKMEELTAMIEALKAKLVVFDNDLSPNQIREIEKAVSCKVLDRSELILDIFAGRASTRQAKLQVEIAQLEYTAPRLRAMWSHLGQVTGGAPVGVGTRGPGEQQIETDRRLVQRRLLQLKRELAEVQARKTREVEGRRLEHYTVGIVGYTNAGKSTLFNALTRGGAFAHGKLFATLGTRVEQWNLGGGNSAMLSDTVGFIRNLPHHLVASFRSTLEETVHAHLLLVVADASDPAAEQELRTVHEVLAEIDADRQPRVLVLNKIDAADAATLAKWREREPEAIQVSAKSGEGLELLRAIVLRNMMGAVREVDATVPLNDDRTIDFLEKRADVLDRRYADGTVTLRVRLGRRQLEQLLSRGTAARIDGLPAQEALRQVWDPSPVAAPLRVPPHLRYDQMRDEADKEHA
ncbi:MAG: GTPase HflX [Phycisphaerales bacterium]|nr:GTPase HflX [Phycisphaerales bacterium]